MRILKLVIILMLLHSLAFGEASRLFDDANDNIIMGNVLDVTTGNVSLGCWVKPTEDATADAILNKKSSLAAVTDAGYFIRQGSNDNGLGGVADGTAGIDEGSGGPDLDGVWSYIVFIWEGGAVDTGEFFTNSATNGSATPGATGSLTNTQNLTIGETGGGGSDFNGLASSCSVWLAKLTEYDREEARWFPERTNTRPNVLLPLWGASTEQDLSGNGLTGTVTGAITSTDGPPIAYGSGLPL